MQIVYSRVSTATQSLLRQRQGQHSSARPRLQHQPCRVGCSDHEIDGMAVDQEVL